MKLDDDGDNIPLEFKDAITQKVMHIPVKIHKAAIDVDKSTLIRLILEDNPRDPFTRTPLVEGSYSINTDLKTKINNWRMKSS